MFHAITDHCKVPSHEALSDGGLLSSITRAYSNYQHSQVADSDENFAGALEQVDQKIPLFQSSCDVSYNFAVV